MSKNKRKNKAKVHTYIPPDAPDSPSRRSTLPIANATPGPTFKASSLKFTSEGRLSVSNTQISSSLSPDDPFLSNEDSETSEVEDGADDDVPWAGFMSDFGLDPEYLKHILSGTADNVVQDGEFTEETLPAPDHNPSRQSKGDKAIHDWTKHVDTFLRSMLRLEGRGEGRDLVCATCSRNALAEYRCLNCDNLPMCCQTCMVDQHKKTPLHRIQHWKGQFFGRTTLKSLGLRIQLGHADGTSCPRSIGATGDDFIILDVDQIHEIGLDYCGCGLTGQSDVEQLMERRLYPATTIQPRTAATFRLLELFEVLQYESKLSPYEYHNTISRLTDNTGINKPDSRYLSLIRMTHEWRHLKLLKRSGRGHDATRSAQETLPGECALLCPPCPHPDINMPDGWEDEPDETRYLHAANLALDGNFRLKRKDISSDAADPGLSQGFSYFVANAPFEEFVELHMDDQEEKSSCSRHDAVNLADARPGQGWSVSGVATVECARHNTKRGLGVGDLQRGERYCNIDYLLVSTLAKSKLKTYYISYDICCQYCVNIRERLHAIDPECRLLQPEVVIRYLVPKFHLPAHVATCRTKFAFMNTHGAALGDGEAPERGWGDSNPLASSTREMGPGSRRDVLDFNFGDYNWKKTIILDSSLLNKLTGATGDVSEHVIAHRELEATINPMDLQNWTAAVEAWENDPSLPSPFETTSTTPTQASVRRELAEDEKVVLEQQNGFAISDDVSPSALISLGLDLEAEQRSVKKESKAVWTHSRDRQLTRLQLRSNALLRKIESWYRVLQLYIPGTAYLRARNVPSKSVAPYDVPLWLPSQIGDLIPYDLSLAHVEFKLRRGQAYEALDSIRRALQMSASFKHAKARWVRGQSANTRAHKAINAIQARIDAGWQEYCKAYDALNVLAPVIGSVVDSALRSLTKKDLRPMVDEDGTEGTTRRVLSWIWRTVVDSGDQHAWVHDTVRVEWGKSRSRAKRHLEEIELVQEEMNRTLRFLIFKSHEWEERGEEIRKSGPSSELSSDVIAGAVAYAERQSSLFHRLFKSFVYSWKHVPTIVREAADLVGADLITSRYTGKVTLPSSCRFYTPG